MGLRFRKSIKVAPGVRVNVGKKSVGVSVGTKGARASINSSGRRTTSVGIPGTGISYVNTYGGGKKGDKTRYLRREGDIEYDIEDDVEEDSVNLGAFNPEGQRKKAKNAKTNSVILRIGFIIMAAMSLLLSVAYPVCFVLCALFIFGFVHVNKTWRKTYEEQDKAARIAEAIGGDINELSKMQEKANETESLIELIFIYEKMKPLVETIKEKAAPIDPSFSFDPDEIMRESFDGKFSELIEDEYQKNLNVISNLKTRKGMDGHIQQFRSIVDSNREKFSESQNKKIDEYINDLERVKEMVAMK